MKKLRNRNFLVFAKYKLSNLKTIHKKMQIFTIKILKTCFCFALFWLELKYGGFKLFQFSFLNETIFVRKDFLCN